MASKQCKTGKPDPSELPLFDFSIFADARCHRREICVKVKYAVNSKILMKLPLKQSALKALFEKVIICLALVSRFKINHHKMSSITQLTALK